MKKVLVTGSSGLIGSATCAKFAKEGWEVYGVDNYQRKQFLELEEADTNGLIQELQAKYPSIRQFEYDIRDTAKITSLIKQVDAIIHCAAQVSHPKSLEIPIEDALVNIMGTLNLLEIVKKENPQIPFAFLSSNKVYGDYPNYSNYKILENKIYRRYENLNYDSFNEELPIDRCGHTPFGVSKTAADLYCQEYARNFDLKTATFRGGCLTGINQKAVEMHGFLGFFTKQVLSQSKLHVYGGGYRVRDNMDSSDVAEIIYLWIQKPKPNALGQYGTPYNIGGMRENAVSIFEALDAIHSKTGIQPIYDIQPERKSDHLWWITDMSKFKRDYPQWPGITKDLDNIFNDLLKNWIRSLDLEVTLQNPHYFRDLRGKN